MDEKLVPSARKLHTPHCCSRMGHYRLGKWQKQKAPTKWLELFAFLRRSHIPIEFESGEELIENKQ